MSAETFFFFFYFIPSTFLPQKHVSDWKPEMRLPFDSDYIVLSGLEWNTEYEVHVVAENQQGKSKPGILAFKTDTEPTTVPGTIPIIPPRASTHTSHSAHWLLPWPENLLFGSLTFTRCLFKACWLQGQTWIICLCLLHRRGGLFFTAFISSNQQEMHDANLTEAENKDYIISWGTVLFEMSSEEHVMYSTVQKSWATPHFFIFGF